MATITLPKALATVALTLTVAACGASNATPAADAPPSTTTTIERPDGLVDELVAIDSGRMHLRCNGSGDTTVLLIAGWGDGGESWGAIEPTAR